MPIFRTALRGLGRTLAMPVTAPARQAAQSAGNIAGSIAELRQRRAAQAADIEAQARELRLDELDAAQRFETVRAARGLTDEDLARKLQGVRRNRRTFVLYAVALSAGGLAWLLSASGPIGALAGVCLLAGGVMAAGKAFHLGLGQHQLEQRRLDGVSVYLARGDLFRHWLGW